MARLNFGGSFVNKVGDTMTGTLTFSSGSPVINIKIADTGEIFNVSNTSGMFFGSGDFRVYTNGSSSQYRFEDATTSFTLGQGTSFGWRNTTDVGSGNIDTAFAREGISTLGFRNISNPTTANILRLYNTWTNASNYERFALNWSGNLFTMVNEAAGTGTLRTYNLGASGKGNVGQIWVDYTNTGTVGNVTISKAAGRVNLGAGQTTLTVTNTLVTAASHIFLNSDGAPGNVVAVQFYAVAAAGSFTVNAVPAVTNQTAIDFFVVNAD